MANARKLAVKALMNVESDGAYSNITLNSVFMETDVNAQDKRLASAIFYGVLDRKITLDFILAKFVKEKLKKTAPYTLTVLRAALYQIIYMDGVPNSAAVNEAVTLMKESKHSHSSGFVNAVLRNVLRTGITLPTGDTTSELSIRYSCPLWIVKSFIADYGIDIAKALLEESLKAPHITLRVNTLKTTSEELKAELEKYNIKTFTNENHGALVVEKGFDIQNNSLYKKGLFHAQDLASQTAVSILAPKPHERVLDICAAPGGKTFTMAEIMENKGEIVACDLYPQRVKLIEAGAKRLGINIIKTVACDATVFNSELGEFDCILCDVPCSGLGVIRRKPEIKYKDMEEYENITEIQLKILSNAIKYLKPGGRILYSTCTLRREENEILVKRFQNVYNSLHKTYEHVFMPHIDNTDGFYCALLLNATN